MQEAPIALTVCSTIGSSRSGLLAARRSKEAVVAMANEPGVLGAVVPWGESKAGFMGFYAPVLMMHL